MFENISERLLRTIKNLRGQGRLTEENIKSTLREVRIALLEADVALPVVKEFISCISNRAIGEEVVLSLTPGQVLIKIVYEELKRILGGSCSSLNLRVQTPAVILVAGLQGSGKTTSVAKLAYFLKGQAPRRKILLASCDTYRFAAIEQLKKLAVEVGVEFYANNFLDSQPEIIAAEALTAAKLHGIDVLIVDSAGRLHIDHEMMLEIKHLHHILNPVETLFVIDSMTGQDAINVAQAFNNTLSLTGIIITKIDGDTRGGAVLSACYITNKPVKFIGTGEKITAFEIFYPERIAARILGKGDVLGLVEEIEKKVDKEKAIKLVKKFQQGRHFTLEDFREQMEQMVTIGGIAGFLDKMPEQFQLVANRTMNINEQLADKEIKRSIAIINSMTPRERRLPDLIKGSRKRRIAVGSGTSVQDVNRLLRYYNQTKKIMHQVKGNKLTRVLKGLKMSHHNL